LTIAMAEWSSCTEVDARPEDVLGILCDPEACRRWSPVPFDVDGVESVLRAGTRARVGGRLLGRELRFDVDIVRADDRAFALTARGPIEIHARYEAEPAPAGARTRLRASVRVRGRGITGGLLSRATDGLLAAGALDQALGRIAAEVRA
jgi:hypothetical protein